MKIRPREVADQAAAEAFLARHNILRGARLGELVHPMDHPTFVAETAEGRLAGTLRYVLSLSRSKNRICHGDLQVFHASGSVGVFVDQAAQDGYSADLLSVNVGHRGAGAPGSSSGTRCAMPWCGRAVL